MHVAGFSQLIFVLFDQQKWTDEHAELPQGYLVYPSSKVSAFPFCKASLNNVPPATAKTRLCCEVCKEGSASLESMPGWDTRGRDRVSQPTLHSWCHKQSKDSNS